MRQARWESMRTGHLQWWGLWQACAVCYSAFQPRVRVRTPFEPAFCRTAFGGVARIIERSRHASSFFEFPALAARETSRASSRVDFRLSRPGDVSAVGL